MVTQARSHVFLLFFGLMSRVTNEEERYANTNNSIFIVTTSILKYTNLMHSLLHIKMATLEDEQMKRNTSGNMAPN